MLSPNSRSLHHVAISLEIRTRSIKTRIHWLPICVDSKASIYSLSAMGTVLTATKSPARSSQNFQSYLNSDWSKIKTLSIIQCPRSSRTEFQYTSETALTKCTKASSTIPRHTIVTWVGLLSRQFSSTASAYTVLMQVTREPYFIPKARKVESKWQHYQRTISLTYRKNRPESKRWMEELSQLSDLKDNT